MALDTVSLSDIGISLVSIESEIKSNLSTIDYYEQCIRDNKSKIALLQDTARALIKHSLPHILMMNGDLRP